MDLCLGAYVEVSWNFLLVVSSCGYLNKYLEKFVVAFKLYKTCFKILFSKIKSNKLLINTTYIHYLNSRFLNIFLILLSVMIP